MSKKYQSIINIALVIIFLLFLVFLNNRIQVSNKSEMNHTTNSKLNVAIVNEDKTVTSNEKEYNLGASYIKNIERDDSQNWSIVSRGTAESGLESGKYQLILTIPTDFSTKILDINNANVDKVNISYKVNSNGNLQIENEANKVGKDIVSDLNKQLVDLYIASILTNLYTAQQNVQSIAHTQSSNIGSYRANLYQPALDFKSYFPSLVTQTNQTVASNDSLVTSLDTTIKLYTTFGEQQTTLRTNFDGLVTQRSEGRLSYEDFVKSLLELDQSLLSEGTEKLFSDLKATQIQLTTQLGTGEATTAADFTTAINHSIDEQITQLKEALLVERNKLQEQQSGIARFVDNHLATYFGKETDAVQTITLHDFVMGTPELTAAYTQYEKEQKDILRAAVHRLPALNPQAMLAKLNALDPTASEQLQYDVADFVTRNFGESFAPSRLEAELDAALLTLNQEKTASEVVVLPSATDKQVTVEASAPSSVQIESITVNGLTYEGQTATVPIQPTDNTFVVHYKHVTAVTDTETETDETIRISVDGEPFAAPKTNEAAYHQATAAYAAKVQEVIDAYNQVDVLVDAYYPMDAAGNRVSLTSSFFNQSVSQLLINLMTSSLTNNLKEYEGNRATSQASLDERISELEGLRDTLKTQLAAIKETNVALGKQITAQLVYLEELKAQLRTISTRNGKYTTDLAATDTNVGNLSEELTKLLVSTSDVKTTATQNSEEAKNVNTIFTSFNEDVKRAQSNSEKLSNEADAMMGEFDKELTASGDFVASFVKVLNNAYNNGVPNEVLLDFLSKPVSENASSVKATENVYQPFTWILLLEVVTLFAAYVFATQNVVQKVKDKFKVEHPYLKHGLNVLVLSGLGLVVGVALGVVSSTQLKVEPEYLPSWVMLMVLFSLILVQAQYLLIKHLKAIGMGLSLFMLISFVYLSNAVGTTVVLKGLPALIKRVNFLSFVESSLSGYFTNQPVGFAAFLALVVLTIGLAAANSLDLKKKVVS